ncbi:MAG: hypothetical protein AAGU75_04040 [Bacillota bacterium]
MSRKLLSQATNSLNATASIVIAKTAANWAQGNDGGVGYLRINCKVTWKRNKNLAMTLLHFLQPLLQAISLHIHLSDRIL